MNRPNYDTSTLWRILTLLISVLLTAIILTVIYLPLKKHIDSALNKPKYNQEQLDNISRKRNTQRSIERNEDWDLIENGIHLKTGLKADKNLKLIIATCTSCHSAKLITQNKATREGWKNMIVWMQATQGLTDLGDKEPLVLDYLEKYYAPEEIGRRKNLDIAAIEWYILNLEEPTK